ncbi:MULTISPECIES: hypothetical protein [unclassified Sporosarcina]|uniref:hypothetical protein n=1 Tax=unclassified Sporosarcina TaxID=2647733 RepID=UPI0018EDC32F|nr:MULTISPECIES: hypothetical protein [unclassified Sporosarcina]
MDAVDAGVNIIFFIIIIYLISRVANFIKHTKDKLDEMDKKIDGIREYIDSKD